ncbi:MAG TPA: ATP-binding protein [Polyangia bacterium]|jgi:PAS domain S-box-containing protein
MDEHDRAEAQDIVRAIRDGEIDAFVVREAAEERIYSLRSADTLYRAMIEEMRDGAVALDASGLIVYCNAYFAQLVQAERATIVGVRIHPFVAGGGDGFFELKRHGTGAGTSPRELTLLGRNGATVPVLAAMNHIDLEGTEVYCLIVTDLTDQKYRDQLLVEGRRKDEFLAMLAHELRNPIAPIRYAVERLRIAGATPERVDYAREVIGRQVDQLTRLVDDLLDVSRITRGKVSLDLAPLAVETVIARAVEVVRPLIEARRQDLRITQPGARLRVQGDAVRLAQVISNLLHNAAKFTPEGGQVDLVVEEERDRSGSGPGWVRVVVADNGAGIPPHLLPDMFNLFVQADTPPGRSLGGLGIGLMLVRTFVEMHGGTVSGESPGPGQGSRFTVRLPLHGRVGDREVTSLRNVPSIAATPSPRRIVVVDDNADVADSLAAWLADCGHEVRVARTGEAALREAQAFAPDVMLIDIGLPDMSGHEAVAKLRRMPETANSVLIAVTGFGQAEDRRLSEASGFDGHWIKPVSFEALSALLASLEPKTAGS